MRKIAFFVGYGLLPFWAATAIVLIGAAFSQSSDYSTAAPWLVVFSIPICGATLLAAAITLIMYARADGDAFRKKAVATKWFWALNALLIGIAGLWLLQMKSLNRDIEAEKNRALAYVRSHETVVQRFGTDLSVNLASYTTNRADGKPRSYEVSIDTNRHAGSDPNSRYVYAIVRVERTANQRNLVLDCITPLSIGYRDGFKDPCKQ